MKTKERARCYLEKMPGAIEGNGGDSQTFTVACLLVNDFKLDYEDSFELIREWNTKCQPMWSEQELVDKLENANRYSNGNSGSKLSSIRPNRSIQARHSLLSLKDFLNEESKPLTYLLEGILPETGSSVLGAKAKVGKSTLARPLMKAVARGEEFLGRETKKGPVIFLMLEGSRDGTREELRKLGLDEEPIYLHLGSLPGDYAEYLEVIVQEYSPKLVVVDTLMKFAKIKDINEYSQVVPALEKVTSIAERYKTHVMLIHHNKKGDDDGAEALLGSTGIMAAVDTILLIKKKGEDRILSTTQRYGEDIKSLKLELDSQTGDISSSEVLSTEKLVEDRILSLLNDAHAPQSENQIYDLVEGKRATKLKALRGLVEAGKVSRYGSGKKGDPYLYSGTQPPSLGGESGY